MNCLQSLKQINLQCGTQVHTQQVMRWPIPPVCSTFQENISAKKLALDEIKSTFTEEHIYCKNFSSITQETTWKRPCPSFRYQEPRTNREVLGANRRRLRWDLNRPIPVFGLTQQCECLPQWFGLEFRQRYVRIVTSLFVCLIPELCLIVVSGPLIILFKSLLFSSYYSWFNRALDVLDLALKCKSPCIFLFESCKKLSYLLWSLTNLNK